MITIDFDNANLEALAAGLNGTKEQIEAARGRALKKTAAHIRTLVKREVAKKERMPQKALGNRFFISRVAKGVDEVSVWIGTQNVSPFAIGQPMQTATGVRAGRRTYRGAFLGTIYTSREKVWIRLRSDHYDPELYPTKKQHHAGYRGNLSASQFNRFPVVKAAIPIESTVKSVVESNDEAISTEFLKKFKQELTYEIFIKGM